MASADDIGSREQALANGYRLLRSDPASAAEQASEMLRIEPNDPDALHLNSAALRGLGREQEAADAEMAWICVAARQPVLAAAAKAIADNDLKTAEQLVRPHLKQRPWDAAALALLAEIAVRLGLHAEAEHLLKQALAAAPAYDDAALALAKALFSQSKVAESVAVLDTLLARHPGHVAAGIAKGTTLGQIGAYDEAVSVYEDLIGRAEDDAELWIGYGNVLKTVGRQEDSLSAFRRALALRPQLGEAWWSIANFKTVSLTEADIDAMEVALTAPQLDENSRLHLHFALGKAFEDAAEAEQSFAHYAEGNQIRRVLHPYDPVQTSDEVRSTEQVFTPDFLRQRVEQGCQNADPIFILGMPRAGSTLIEQILASHSQVEGTAELPYIPALAQRLLSERWQSPAPYPALLRDLTPDALRRLGEDYLDAASIHRRTGRRHFIDKLPNNWLQIGFINLILPNARIIDARRHPLDCCFSNFKQQFARGQDFAYALTDLGLYYRDYVELMAHFDAALPARVYRVIHERLIENPEAEVRRLLDHLGLPFEESCLHFHENERAVRTASSEQVRRPINREGVGQWKPYERWLDPLKTALGPVLDSYPDAPAS